VPLSGLVGVFGIMAIMAGGVIGQAPPSQLPRRARREITGVCHSLPASLVSLAVTSAVLMVQVSSDSSSLNRRITEM